MIHAEEIRVKGHDVCNLLANGSAKEYGIYVYRERVEKRQQISKNVNNIVTIKKE